MLRNEVIKRVLKSYDGCNIRQYSFSGNRINNGKILFKLRFGETSDKTYPTFYEFRVLERVIQVLEIYKNDIKVDFIYLNVASGEYTISNSLKLEL